MTSQPEPTSVEPRKLSVRRAPKYVPFMIAGGIVGIIAAAVMTMALPPNEQFSASSVFGMFTVLMLIPGVGLGAIAALMFDRQSQRRAKTLVAQPLPDDESNIEAETA
ncbi:hypothetical protein [Arthrobacter psychrolactophilus]